MTDTEKLIVRAGDRPDGHETIHHPLNPMSEAHVRPLSDLVGLRRVGFTHVRIPPGKESFIYHSLEHEEEFLYVLSGRGVAEIGDDEYEVGPGDFMGFPTPSVGHHMKNPFADDLVYLMGGEARDAEVADFPRLRKRLFRSGKSITVVDYDDLKDFW